ncbi:MAG: STAS/SEC14 domain-containing protein [Pseudomonadota bacterium]|nr:STAS/SEC14 domain-containing protein [Pseudomonadota bacterium]
MTDSRHGISIGLNRVGDDIFMVIKAVGKLTHDDYQMLTPMLDAAAKEVEHPQIRVLFDASEFDGWELHAAWDDFRLGLKHGSEFGRIALYGDHRWQAWAAKIGSWFIRGEMQSFTDYDSAMAWLQA